MKTLKSTLTIALGLAAATALHAQLGQPPAPLLYKEPLSNAFLTASETVIDEITTADLTLPDSAWNGQMVTLNSNRQNLSQMAETDHTHDVMDAINDLYFTLSSCRIQAVDNTPLDTCHSRMDHAANRAMHTIGMHKDAGRWLPGPPKD